MRPVAIIMLFSLVLLGACAGGDARGTRAVVGTPAAFGLSRTSGTPARLEIGAGGIPRDPICPRRPFGVTGRTFYYCDCAAGNGGSRGSGDCRPGNDRNDGKNTSPNRPARSLNLAFARFNKLAPGESIALCRGGTFASAKQTRLYNNSCKPGKRCGIMDYFPPGSRNGRRPTINASGHGLIFSNPGPSARDGGYFTRNLNLRGSGRANSSGVLIYNEADDVHLCGMRVEGFHTGVRVAAFNGPPISGDGLSERIELRKSELINNTARGWNGGGSGFVVRENYFYNNGHGESDRYSHSIYISGNYGSKAVSRGMVVSDNRIEKNAHGPGGGCGDSVIAVHGRHEGLMIEGNRIVESPGSANRACRGIMVAPAYDTPELLRNITVQRNRIEFVGGESILTRSCENCRVRNNKVLTGGY